MTSVDKAMPVEAERYIYTIRNRNKREYARAYWAWLRGWPGAQEPAYRCSYMAAQAVRMNLAQLNQYCNPRTI